MVRIINALWAAAIVEEGAFEQDGHTWFVKLNKKRTKVTVFGECEKIAEIRTAGHTMFDLARAIKTLCENTTV